jgi:acyl carrier protein
MSQLRSSADFAADLLPAVTNLIRSVSAKAKELEVSPQSLLHEELALDSLDLVRVVMQLEEQYSVSMDLDQIPKMKHVRDLIALVDNEVRSAA